jgi:MFS family permease
MDSSLRPPDRAAAERPLRSNEVLKVSADPVAEKRPKQFIAAAPVGGAVPSFAAVRTASTAIEPAPDEISAALDEKLHESKPAPRSDAEKLDRRYIVAALMLVMVLASMEQTVTSTAMPTIIGELHGLEHYSWVASLYLLACTVSMPVYGRLADTLGRKRVILFAISLFAVASMLAASAHSMIQLVLFRGLQGLGAGGIMPVVLTILGDVFTLQERVKIQGLFSGVWGTASLAGPALGAFLVKTLGWRSVFFVNLPLGFLGIVVLAWKYQDRQRPGDHPELDLPGAILLSLGCTMTLGLASGLGPGGWSWPICVAMGALALACFIWFIGIERRSSHPILPPDLLMRRDIGPAILGSGLMGLGFLSLDTYVPLYVQGAQGGGVGAAAGVVTPVMLMWALSGVFAAPLVVKHGFRNAALIGNAFICAGFLGLVICALTGAPHYMITGVLSVTGLGFGFCSMSYLLAAQDAVEYAHRGIVTSSVTFFRTMGGAVGIGVLGGLFNMLIGSKMHALEHQGVSAAAILNPDATHSMPPETVAAVHHMISGGLQWVFVVMLASAVAAAIVGLLMPRGKRASAEQVKHAMSEAAAG